MSIQKEEYIKKDHVSWVLHRPDSYLGSTHSVSSYEYVSNNYSYIIERKNVNYNNAILRIFIEPLSNIIDNVPRSMKHKVPMKKISIDIDRDTGLTTLRNDGYVIPIEKNISENEYNHSLIFGHLLTSSNYDDTQERKDQSGRNGIGIKATNIFSSEFKVEGCDPNSHKTFCQIWKDNMKTIEKPIIKPSSIKTGYTNISYIPDFKRFGMIGYTEDILELYKKYIIDLAMVTKIPVYYNNILVPVKSLSDYANLYMSVPTSEILFIKTKDCEVVVTPAEIYENISFVNGVLTPLGGVHVDSWNEALFRPLVDKLNKPKNPQVTLKDVKNCFRVFIMASVINPVFNSQEKTRLEFPVVKADVKKSHITTMSKWSIMTRLQDIIRGKDFIALKKIERKRRGFIKIDELTPANLEGGKRGRECTLMIVEGLSAKTYADFGIEVGVFGKKGKDFFGIFKLNGKILNVRCKTASTISSNSVIKSIIQALNLNVDLDYTVNENYNTLRYGRVMILTDQDVDGHHISSLFLNVIHCLYPSLLERDIPFLVSMQTPIVSISTAIKDHLFYDEISADKFAEEYYIKCPNKKITIKYYKGLGSSDEDMVAKTFGKKMIEFTKDDKLDDNMNKVFHKNFSDQRKEWLSNYDPDKIKLFWEGEGHQVKRHSISDFLDGEMIKFSIEDCGRSIPHILDGFKVSQRKIFYGAQHKNLKFSGNEMKVAQLGAYVAQHTEYHHGEQNLYDTLVKMAQNFVGSNNIPLFCRGGQFGSRNNGGKDAAAARYIFTKFDKLTRLIFHPDDDNLLKYLQDDGTKVEPEYYIPIIPMILVNGCLGIGSGWSTQIPCYNPIDIVESIKVWLKYDGKVIEQDEDSFVSLLPELIPWYKDYTGKIEPDGNNKYISYGRVVKEKGKFIINELPIGMWTDNYRDKLDAWVANKQLKSYKNYSTPKLIKFVVTEAEDGFICNQDNLKLHSYIYTSNMVLFTEQGLKKFNNVDEIIDMFCTTRLAYYTKRKINIINKIKAEITLLGNKKRFMEEVIKGIIKVFKTIGTNRVARPTADIVALLEERKYDKNYPKSDESEETTNHGYNYLLSMQFRSITEEKINKLKNDIASLIKREKEIQQSSEKQHWLNDLDIFLKEYELMLKSKKNK
jgi:DNA topoisomerase-2